MHLFKRLHLSLERDVFDSLDNGGVGGVPVLALSLPETRNGLVQEGKLKATSGSRQMSTKRLRLQIKLCLLRIGN